MIKKNIIINHNKLSIKETDTIKKALKIINYGKENICFVIKNKKLLYTISDGDIRRGLLHNLKLSDKVSKLSKRKSTTLSINASNDQLSLIFNRRIKILPILDDNEEMIGFIRSFDIEKLTNIKSKEVAVIGLGYVGLTLGLVMAKNGFTVTGYDINKNLIKKLNKKISPFHEQGIDEYISLYVNNNFRLISKIDNHNFDVYIIAVGTPLKQNTKEPNINYLVNAVKVIAKKIQNNDLVILRSTVPLGCTRKIVIPILEKYSGLKVGKDFSISFCPERTVEGKALKELEFLPQIIGGYDYKSYKISRDLFIENTNNIINVKSLESAEMCKLLDNTYRDTVFAYSNQMALLSEKLSLNLPDLIKKVNIGYERNSIPAPSPGVGGPCLSKDPHILITSFKQNKVKFPIIKYSRTINESILKEIFKRCKKSLKAKGKPIKECKIFISGIAFKGKPKTSDTRGSTSIELINIFKKNKVKRIFCHDFNIPAREFTQMNLTYISIERGFKNADCVIIMNNNDEYLDLKINSLVSTMKKPCLFYDAWGIFMNNNFNFDKNLIYCGVGF